jgi:octaprenyl-diphosphate synthase
MDYLSIIRKPIEGEMNDFVELFNKCLSQGEGLLEQVLSHIRQRGGKRMRPMLILLTAKNYGVV